MFGLLKSKLTGFIKGLTGREEAKEPEKKPPVETVKEELPEIVEEKKPERKEEKEIHIPKVGEKPVEENRRERRAEKRIPVPKVEEKPGPAHAGKEPPKPVPAPVEEIKPEPVAAPPVQKKSFIESIFGAKKEAPKPVVVAEAKKEAQKEQARGETKPTPIQTIPPEPRAEAKPDMAAPHKPQEEAKPTTPSFREEPAHAPREHDLASLERKAASEHRGMAPKIGIGTAIKSFFSGEITIGEAEVNDLLEELELSLLEADVAYDVSLEVTQQLRTKLVGMKVPKGEVEKRTKEAIQGILEGVMDSERKFDFLERVRATGRPVKILFVGPNGAGKTTTIAKIARKLMDSGLTVIFSASDTFRAAAIEQTEVHGERLGVKVIKSKYGADPASVAFDAVNHARSNGIDVVLIDSAGRQDTNANLLSELKKINRVAKPDMKLYVGESIGGNALLEQIKAFNEAIGIDGAILTKIDCDAKGGTAISISKSTGIPIIFLGIGQRYEDLIPFDAHRIAQEIMA